MNNIHANADAWFVLAFFAGFLVVILIAIGKGKK